MLKYLLAINEVLLHQIVHILQIQQIIWGGSFGIQFALCLSGWQNFVYFSKCRKQDQSQFLYMQWKNPKLSEISKGMKPTLCTVYSLRVV